MLNALKSINNLCDKIIVVDTGSTDNTINNIEKHFPNVEIHQIPWIEDYSYMRNKTLQYVDSGWVLVLDSDEVLQGCHDYREVHNFVGWLNDNTSPQVDIICTIKCVNDGFSCFVRKKCLYRFSKKIFYHGLVHEELVSRNSHVKLIDTNLKIINKGENKDQIKKFKKTERYTSLLLKQISLEPNNPRWISLISPSYVGKKVDRRKYIEKKYQNFLFKNSVNDFSIDNLRKNRYLKYNLFRYIILLASVEGKFELALAGAKAGMKIFPWDANFLSIYMSIRNDENDLENYKSLSIVVNKLKTYKNNLEKVNEESQGSEDALDELIVLLLVKVR